MDTDDLNPKTHVGDRVPVIYVDGRACWPDGSTEWLKTIALILFGLVIIGCAIRQRRFAGPR
ncbi:hypothetical protein GCM10009530_03850 [Microbispora corallina]|uniref:IPTL-CTERM sorting domain-containing protein n=1 Tax=Microbispora corallina TaxID=83302 RepID=A0ABQ4FRE6_9ACTN|nr:hypothetical protein Mco01_03880 [Microbispora corallina]